jgi:penicillin-binding protein 2
MFERRLKIFLAVLLLVTLTLVLRAAQLQVLEHRKWEEQAQDMSKRSAQVETRRGMIRDYKGVVLAMDEPCVDVCVDYRALAPELDKDWVREVARSRLKDRLGSLYADATLDRKNAMIAGEIEQVRVQLRDLLPRLAKACGKKGQELEDLRQGIVEKVKMRRRYLWYYNYAAALNKHEKDLKAAQTRPSSVWQKWLLDDSEDPPELDSFKLSVADETAKHVIVRDVDPDVQTELGRHSDRFPGLELRTGNRRIYPLGPAAAHVLGRVTKVTRADRDADPNRFDLLRQYQQNDLRGRGGLEELCEPVLRGVRGEVAVVDGREVSRRPPEPGQDVYASIDVELQQQVEALFQAVPISYPGAPKDVFDPVAMHGAAVVIDVASGEVRVLASAPGFDPNTLDERFARLSSPDNLDMPLLNRATMATREPGSTVKPIVGIAGVASGVRRPDEGYECTGYMVVNGRYYQSGRCWVNSMFHKVLCGPDCKRFPCPLVAHHPVPSSAPHPTGFLTLPDALERSCNPYFESIAHALGPDRLSEWYHKFGLGRPTYIGIAERSGTVPGDYKILMSGPRATSATWSAGIGQGPVAVTPLQMANVAATIARGGVWVRPKLLREGKPAGYPDGAQQKVPPTTQLPDRVDLGVPPEALAAVKRGMFNVVNGAAGSGDAARRRDVVVAGKTGTAEAALLKAPLRDPKTGKLVVDSKGRVELGEPLALSSHDVPNTLTPWYRATGREGDSAHHSWFIGFAPAEHPQIAFAVLVEYGGSGGGAAGSVASKIVELCIAHDHLKLPPKGAWEQESA